jgi:hypothetical protein
MSHIENVNLKSKLQLNLAGIMCIDGHKNENQSSKTVLLVTVNTLKIVAFFDLFCSYVALVAFFLPFVSLKNTLLGKDYVCLKIVESNLKISYSCQIC